MKRYTDKVLSATTGLPLIGASVTVYLAGTQTLALLHVNDDLLGAKLSNPFQPVLGGFSFYVADGSYDIVVSTGPGPANRSVTLRDVQIYDLTELSRLIRVRPDKGDPGGNVLSVASFVTLRAAGQGPVGGMIVISSGTDTVRTSCYKKKGKGAAFYQQRDDLTDQHVIDFPLTMFRAKNELGVITRWALVDLYGWDYEALGAVPYVGIPSALNDCSPSFDEMQRLNVLFLTLANGGPARGISFGEIPGRRINLGQGRFHHMSTWQLHAKWDFEGQGGGTGGGAINTELTFAPGIICVVFNRHNTHGDQVGPENSQGASDGTALRRLGIRSMGGVDPTKHGVWGRARGVLEDVTISDAAGNNLHIVANSSTDGVLGTNLTAGNANDFQLNRVTLQGSGRHAVYISGIDANSIVSVGLSVLSAGCGGIIDLNFLGNSHFGPSIHTCGQAAMGSVSHGGRRFRLISATEGIGAATMPGTANTIWYDVGAGGIDGEFKAWSNAGTYVASGGLLITNPNSRSVVTGGYPEYATIGKCHVVPPSTVQGGWLDTEFTTYTSFQFIPTGVGNFMSHNGGWGSYRPTTGSPALAAAYGDFLMAAFAEEMLENGGTFIRVARHNASLWDFRAKYLGLGAGVAFDWGNDGNNPFIHFIGPNYQPLHGRTTKFGDTERFPVKMRHGVLLANDGRLIAQQAGLPAGGQDYAAGEFSFNTQVADACSGYYSTVAAGGPGGTATWWKSGALFRDMTAVYDPPSLAAGTSGPVQTVAMAGATAGDIVRIGYIGDAQGVEFKAWIAPNGTINYYAHNPSGNPLGTIDLANNTLEIRVEKMA